VVRARDVLGKFTFVLHDVSEPQPSQAGARYLTEDWTRRHAAGPLELPAVLDLVPGRSPHAAEAVDVGMGGRPPHPQRCKRYQQKRAAGHAGPDVGALSPT
jgi:hypothetical protein